MEIIVAILEACRLGTCKTQVMYKCCLNFKQLEGYLELLLKTNLLTIEIHHRFFMLTISDKGKGFLKTYQTMKTMIEQPSSRHHLKGSS